MKLNMKKKFLAIILAIISLNNYGQCNGRYQTEIFNSVSVSTVNYSDVYNDFFHKMDIYTPDGDTVTNRPVILYMHGGAFYAGEKGSVDCVDFCTSYAKKGYVAISANYRLAANALTFLFYEDIQYTTVLKAVADIKSAVRYLRKDHANGNTLGIHPDGIFLGGYSAGAVLSIHMSYIDSISDLPTSPLDVQALVSTIGGTLDGDAGNDGYSSEIGGIVSFAGGINDLTWVDSTDDPIVFIHATVDPAVNFNCGPGLGQPTVLNLCGMNAMKPALDNAGVLNDTMVYNIGHGWAATGHANPLFTQAVDFSTNFLYPLLPCNNNAVGITEKEDVVKQYPNPANDIVHYSSGKLIKEIIIYNQIGQIKNNIIVNNTEHDVPLTDFERGIYYVKLILGDSSIILKKLSVIK
mgnify:CR=1 FL=1